MRVAENTETLEWHQTHFRESCEACHQKIIVHAFRPKCKFRRATYGHCETIGCRKRMMEVCYLGS